MNFLAHLFLSYEQEKILVGNFLADFLSNREVLLLPEEVRKGVQLHRLIDSFTDNHPIVRKGTHRLHRRHHKYAPVIIDVFYDLLLSRKWSHYATSSLSEFTTQTYTFLRNNLHLMDIPLKRRVENMMAHNWLMSYTTTEGIQYAFERMKMRASKPEQFNDVLLSLEEDYELLIEEFQLFFPDVIEMVKQYLHQSHPSI